MLEVDRMRPFCIQPALLAAWRNCASRASTSPWAPRCLRLPATGHETRRLLFRTRASPLASWGAWFSGDPRGDSAKLTNSSDVWARSLPWVLGICGFSLKGIGVRQLSRLQCRLLPRMAAKAYWDAQAVHLPPRHVGSVGLQVSLRV